jgi:S-DNA-T family DNA segregation ATPase FtsK/SpoIIIE
MHAQAVILLLIGLAVLGWVLHKLGHYLKQFLEVVATIAVVFAALWLIGKGLWWTAKTIVKHWRTTLTTIAAAAWWHWLGWQSLTITVGTIAVALLAWRIVDLDSYDPYAGRHVRSWWQRWTVYAPKMPKWLRACRLTVPDGQQAITINVNPFKRTAIAPKAKPRPDQLPRILGVRSGPSWDEVRVRLVAGQKPEDFDLVARELAVARGVMRCQVRELKPDVVSIDFQRRNLLADTVLCQNLADLVAADGASLDLRRVWSGRTEYGNDWSQALAGGHTLTAGATGAGKGSVMWCPLVSIAPAIRDGLVRVSGIDPKGMELAYGRGIFHRYAVTAKDTVELLDELVAGMDARKTVHAGQVRTVPITRENPLELVEFDEIGALTKYVGDRKTREAITERVALLTTQGRALGYTVRGYVQEPTKDTVPVRELFPRRICLRVAAKSHVGMVLGEHAYERGAWANRIGESEAGVGYVFGEGLREPLRIRAGWVPDEVIKQLESFVTGPTPDRKQATVLALPGGQVDQEFGGAA